MLLFLPMTTKTLTSSRFQPKTILFATDFLASSRLALDYAAALAHHYQSKLLLVNVFHRSQAAIEEESLDGPSVSRLNRETRLEGFARTIRSTGVKVHCELVEGWMPQALLDKVEESQADLAVIGTHGVYRGLSHMLIGSNAEAIIVSTTCPTLTVGRHVLAHPGVEATFERILLITDFTPEAAGAAPYAVALSEEFHAPLEVCHLISEGAVRNPAFQREVAEQFCKAMTGIFPAEEPSWCTPAYHLERGTSGEDILRKTRAAANALIVLGVKQTTQLARHLHTSLAYQLLALAACPILTIRG
jgi:nucleotide-binding universal stress UspA family protein